MTKTVAAILLLWAFAAAQQVVPIPASEVHYRKEIFRNEHLTAFLLEIPPHHETLMHRHDRDILAVFLGGGQITSTYYGRSSIADTIAAGEVRFRSAGFTHATRNDDTLPFRVVILEFAKPVGTPGPATPSTTRYCNPGSETACVDEKHLFCTDKICVHDVSMAPKALRNDAATPDQIVVAVSDYSLTDQAEGKAANVRTRHGGELEYIPVGRAHRWTNAASSPTRFIVVAFR